MKVGSQSPRGTLIVFALAPILLGTGCKSNNQASATVPPAASPSLYPSSLQAAPADNSIFANEEEKNKYTSSSPSKPEPSAFSLKSGESLVSYKVQKGDNLSKIASLYGTSSKRIMAANGLASDTIYAGKTYKIPTKKTEDEVEALKSALAQRSTTTVSAPKPPAAPKPPTSSFRSSTPTMTSATSGSSSSAPRTFSPPPTTDRPTFAPRTFDYNGPQISSPSRSSSITIPTEEASGSGAAFPTPTFGSGTSF
ncbi:MAG: LysM peptidoglycan-binding domain-containing protein [Verrucomicrobiales bacterium]|nr:LysM peptidoglycan-binding domain-containing protein [Verrucomicrobiales bacterium]